MRKLKINTPCAVLNVSRIFPQRPSTLSLSSNEQSWLSTCNSSLGPIQKHLVTRTQNFLKIYTTAIMRNTRKGIVKNTQGAFYASGFVVHLSQSVR